MIYRRIRLGQISADSIIDMAVKELCRYLKQMDPHLEIEIIQTEGVVADFEPVVWVGIDPAFVAKVPVVAVPALDDAIAISVRQNHGYITGTNTRSVLIAAYRFLKELGCDWVRPGLEGERIPQKAIENINVFIYETASYRHRGVCIEGANSYENVAELIDFLPKIGMNAYFMQFFSPYTFFSRWYAHKSNPFLVSEPISQDRVDLMVEKLEQEIACRGLFYHKTGHGWTSEPLGISASGWDAYQGNSIPESIRNCLAQIKGVRDFWKGVPLNTNLCYSNPHVRKQIVDSIVRYSRENTDVDMLHFWLADATNNHCECASCKKMLPSDWYVLMLNELDEALTAAGLHTKIVFLLYVDLLWAPEKIKLNNSDRFVLMFAPITRNYGQNYTDHLAYNGKIPEYKRNELFFDASLAMNLAQLRQWQKHFKGDSFDFDYHLMWAHLNDPGYQHCARNLFEDMKGLASIGLNGMISCQTQRCFFPSALPMQMMAAALWDRNCDYEEKSRAYYLAAFGPEGLLVQRYLKEISDLFALYEGPSHGPNTKIDGCLCKDYAALTRCVKTFLPVIEQQMHMANEWSKEWTNLHIHSEYVLALADALRFAEQRDYESVKAAVSKVVNIVYRNELVIQKVMDGYNTKKHWTRRLDPEQCRKAEYV